MIRLYQRPLLDPRYVAAADPQLPRNLALRPLLADGLEPETLGFDTMQQIRKGQVKS
jgi:hypothetical protein